MALTIYIEGQELVTILCTPTKLNQLVLGFLYSEGIISDKSDVAMMRVCEDDSLAEVRLSKPGYVPPAKRTLASGCGGGTTFQTTLQSIESDLRITPEEILSLMKQLNEQAELYRHSGGVHTAALAAEAIRNAANKTIPTHIPKSFLLISLTPPSPPPCAVGRKNWFPSAILCGTH